jgi:Sec-independent protein secretion pathway component TatC
MDSLWASRREGHRMLVLGIMALGATSGGGMRPLLFILLVLAMLLLLTGAILAVVALRNQRKDRLNGATLEQLEKEAS